VTSLLLAVLTGVLSVCPQESPEEFSLSLRRERLELVRARYEVASEERRQAALELFKEIRSAANPSGKELAQSSLDLVLRALDPEQGGAESPEQTLASALSIRVIPGAFEARTEGLGEATTVHLVRTRDVAIEGDQVLSLYWLGPAGEELRVRREVMPHAILRAGSLEMFVRPPVSAPGSWRLVCEVGMEERARRGLPVRVDCVSDLKDRRSALADLPAVSMKGETPGEALEALCERGVRHPVLGASALLTIAEGDALGRVKPVVHHGSLELHITPLNDPTGTLVLVGGSTYSPLELAAGAASSAWLSFAESERMRIILLDLPLSEREGGLSLPMRIIELREERPEDEFHLVAFGGVAGFVPSMRVRYPELPLDSVTLVSNSMKRSGRDPRLDIRTMLVECSGESPDPVWSREDGFGHVLIREPFVLSAALVPDLMLTWDMAR
jgi:hypothetical protein